MTKCVALEGAKVDVSGAPEVIAILPLGYVKSSKGDFTVDTESLEAMKAQIAQRGVDLVVDYEHQTLHGVQAPAAGWVKELVLKDGAIMARVEWTPTAGQYLANREYRYLSPVVTVRKSDKKAIGLHSLALTNTPAIEGMIPIVNSSTYEGGQDYMEFVKMIGQMLGLAETATEEEITAALKQLLDQVKAAKGAAQPPEGTAADDKVVANKAVCELLDLKAGAAADEVAAKIMELKAGKIDGTDVIAELKALKKKAAARDADDAVTVVLKAGKITPAQKEWATNYALSDPTGFAAFAEKAPQIVPMGEISLGDEKVLKDSPDEATMIACKLLGVTAEDVKKYGSK